MPGTSWNRIVLAIALSVLPGIPNAFPQTRPTPADLSKANKIYQKACQEACREHLDNAEKLFQQALELFPPMPGACLGLGQIQMARKNPAAALGWYLRAKTLYPQASAWEEEQRKNLHAPKETLAIPDAQNFYFRHLLYMGKGEFVRRRAGLDSQNPNFVGREGVSEKKGPFSFEKNESEANLGLRSFSRLYADSPGQRLYEGKSVPPGEEAIPPLFYVYLGGAYLRLGRAAEAEKELQTGILKDPFLPALHFNLSLACFLQGKYSEAMQEARYARKLKFPLPAGYVKDLENRSGLRLEGAPPSR